MLKTLFKDTSGGYSFWFQTGPDVFSSGHGMTRPLRANVVRLLAPIVFLVLLYLATGLGHTEVPANQSASACPAQTR